MFRKLISVTARISTLFLLISCSQHLKQTLPVTQSSAFNTVSPTVTNFTALSCNVLLSSSTMTSGQPLSVQVIAQGGAAPYSIPGQITSFISSTAVNVNLTNSLTTPIILPFSVTVVDAQQRQASCSANITVNPVSIPAPTLACQITIEGYASVFGAPVTVNENTPVNFMISATGGAGSVYTFGNFYTQASLPVATTQEAPNEAEALGVVFLAPGLQMMTVSVQNGTTQASCYSSVYVSAPTPSVIPPTPPPVVHNPLIGCSVQACDPTTGICGGTLPIGAPVQFNVTPNVGAGNGPFEISLATNASTNPLGSPNGSSQTLEFNQAGSWLVTATVSSGGCQVTCSTYQNIVSVPVLSTLTFNFQGGSAEDHDCLYMVDATNSQVLLGCNGGGSYTKQVSFYGYPDRCNVFPFFLTDNGHQAHNTAGNSQIGGPGQMSYMDFSKNGYMISGTINDNTDTSPNNYSNVKNFQDFDFSITFPGANVTVQNSGLSCN